MTASNREVGISNTLTYEGGYTNHPSDPGGPTNWGITIHDARLHWKADATAADVRAMPKSVAIEIYRKKYWAVMHCDDRASGPDVVDFDYGVNSGVGRVFNLRKVLDPLKLSPVNYVKQACQKRSAFLHSLRTFAVFGKGWSRRVADLEAFGVRLALQGEGKPAAPVLRKDAEKHAKKAIAHGTASATVPTAAHAVHWDLSTYAGWVFVGLTAAATIYFVWHYVQNHHRANAYQAQAKAA